ncbi:MAG: TIGR00159 family protein [Ruminococcaceae bacterium]|nr:TIGR00159 family protein [Oscillospiraceae bacterium]
MNFLLSRLNFSITDNIRIMDIVDIGLVACVIYLLILLVRETRAAQLVKGILVVLAILQISKWLQLNTIYYVLENTVQVGLVAVLVIFQPELRRVLEKMGKVPMTLNNIVEEATPKDETAKTVHEVAAACGSLSETKTGALIVMERNTKIGEIISTGIALDSAVSKELIGNLFVPNTPLHDGAVVIRDNQIKAAACFLPLTQNESLSSELGTRHRAGLGMSEVSDAAVIIVSEETGTISLAKSGTLLRHLNAERLEEMLLDYLQPETKAKKPKSLFVRKGKNHD